MSTPAHYKLCAARSGGPCNCAQLRSYYTEIGGKGGQKVTKRKVASNTRNAKRPRPRAKKSNA